MSKEKRYLITTADERTWKFDRPVVFLGEWCRLYNKKHLWESMDAVVAEPFGLQLKQKEKNINYAQVLSAELLVELKKTLNAFHKTNHSDRYWNILLGHWLQRYVKVCFNRYYTIQQVLENYEITGTTIFNPTYNLAVPDSESFIWANTDDLWSSVFYGRAIKYLDQDKIQSDLVAVDDEVQFIYKKTIAPTNKAIIFRFIKTIGGNIFQKLSKEKDAFIINSYLPKWQEIKLQFSLFQFPQLWQSPLLNSVQVDLEQRMKLQTKFRFFTKGKSGFELFVRNLLSELIPICYLEGYAELNKQVASLPWPKNPKFIFTSNNFDTDEIFKAWVGIKVEEGVRYFIGQHGNNYGTLLGHENWVEYQTSDKFFSWGLHQPNHKNIPMFIFKLINKKKYISPIGGLLLIELHSPHRLDINDTYKEFEFYQDQQFEFVELLPENIKKDLTIRLHSAWQRMRWFEDKRWVDRFPKVNLEKGNSSIWALIKRNRLVVHSYDSTGILETLSLNIPTICFWHGGLTHLTPKAKPFYNLLRNVGILADSPKQAAKFIALHWDNIDGWWKSESVQSVRKIFCEQYAQVEKKSLRDLKLALTSQAKK